MTADDCCGVWLVKVTAAVVEMMMRRLDRPLRLNEAHMVATMVAERLGREIADRERERGNVTPAETTAMLTETLRKGAPTDEVVTCRRKRPLSMTKGAIKSRASRRRVKDRAARRVEVVPVEVGEQHIDALERRGHYNASMESIDATKAIAAAVEDLLDAMTPSKKRL